MGNTQALVCCNQRTAQSDKLSEVVVPVPLEKENQAENVEATEAAEDISTDAPPSNEEAPGPSQRLEAETAKLVEEEPVASDEQVEPTNPLGEEAAAADAQAEPSKPTAEQQAAVDVQPGLPKLADEKQQQPVSEPQQPQDQSGTQQQPLSEPQQFQDQPGTQELSTEEVQLEKAEAQAVPPKVQDEDQAKSDSRKAKPAKSRGWCLCGSKNGVAVAADRKKQAPANDSKDNVAVDETVKVVV